MTPGAVRCPEAIRFGVTLVTRCMLAAGHGDAHVGRGLREFDYQRIEWFAGDRRSFETFRTDEYAWDAPLIRAEFVTPEAEAKFRESVRLLAGSENLQWTNDAMATVLAVLDAARADNARLRTVVDEARLVSQWADAIGSGPISELNAELCDLGVHARAALKGT